MTQDLHTIHLLCAVLLLERVHEVGDYWLQNSWMAFRKAFDPWPALVHSLTYYSIFHIYFVGLDVFGIINLSLQDQIVQLVLVGLSHFLIDHFQLPALYSFWLNGKLVEPYEYEGKQFQLFPDGINLKDFILALKTKRWVRIPPPVPPHVILSLDQSWHKTFNTIALITAILS